MSTDWDSQTADELIGKYDDLRIKQSSEIARLTDERDRLRAYVQTIADRGLNSDLTPTMMFGGNEGAMYTAFCDYLRRIDASFREFAADALAGEGSEQ
jgi:hypothetical protein